MAKVVLNWKSPSENKMRNFVKTLDDEKKKEFAKTCIENKDGSIVISKKNAKAWLLKNFDGTDEIEWKDRPKNGGKGLSAVEEIASWLDL